MSDGYTYTGPGRYSGVPAKDISAEAFEGLDPRAKRIVRLAAEYQPVRGYDAQTREELDVVATGRGLNPKDYRTKADLIAALDAPPATGGDGEAE